VAPSAVVIEVDEEAAAIVVVVVAEEASVDVEVCLVVASFDCIDKNSAIVLLHLSDTLCRVS
jgi:hypothetical protein